MPDAKVTKKPSIEELAELMCDSRVLMEIFSQIQDSSTGKSPFDIYVLAVSGKKLPYASVHRWVGILKDCGAIEVSRREESRKGGTKIIYRATRIGKEAYDLAFEKTKQEFLKKAKSLPLNESRNVEGLRAPDLLDAVLKLWMLERKQMGSNAGG